MVRHTLKILQQMLHLVTLCIKELNTRSDKYGSMIHKMYAFVPSVIRGKVERNYKTAEIIHEYRDDLPTPRNAFEYSRYERRWKVLPKENQLGKSVNNLRRRFVSKYLCC